MVDKVEDLNPSGKGNDGKPFYKYRAEVNLLDKNGNKVGSGVAICTNRECGKEKFDEYAVASMAQTRAVGKAYRMKIGWLVKVAGYETTPAEEMDAIQEAKVIQKEDNRPTRRDISYAIGKLETAKTVPELRVIFSTLGDIKSHPEIIAKKDELKEILPDNETSSIVEEGQDGVE